MTSTEIPTPDEISEALENITTKLNSLENVNGNSKPAIEIRTTVEQFATWTQRLLETTVEQERMNHRWREAAHNWHERARQEKLVLAELRDFVDKRISDFSA